MNMKTLIEFAKITSLILVLSFILNGIMVDKEVKTTSVFIRTDEVRESSESDCIEAYQTENSTTMEAYLHEVHYIDQR